MSGDVWSEIKDVLKEIRNDNANRNFEMFAESVPSYTMEAIQQLGERIKRMPKPKLRPEITEWTYREVLVVSENNARARDAGLPATLSVEQWRETLEDFQWRCAYCLEGPYQVLEHFIPLSRNGGTEVTNCLPACLICNNRKSNKTPDELTNFPKKTIARIRYYLDLRKDE